MMKPWVVCWVACAFALASCARSDLHSLTDGADEDSDGDGGDSAHTPPGNWTYSRLLSIHHDALAGAVSGVVIPVQLDAGNFDFTHAQDDGDDVVFEGAAPFERALWSATANTAVLWVKPAAVAAASPHQIHMYYGDAAATPRSDPSATWADYQLVLHFDGTPRDSVRQVELAQSALDTDYLPGVLGSAVSRVCARIPASWRIAAGAQRVVVEMWFNMRAAPSNQHILAALYDETNGRYVLELLLDASSDLGFIMRATTEIATGQADFPRMNIPLQTWAHLVAYYDIAGNQLTLYVNGVPHRRTVGVPGGALQDEAFSGSIAGVPGASSCSAIPNAWLDELTIRTGAITDDEVLLRYSTQAGQTTTAGPEDTYP